MVRTTLRCGSIVGKYFTWHVQSYLPFRGETAGVSHITCSTSLLPETKLKELFSIPIWEECKNKSVCQIFLL